MIIIDIFIFERKENAEDQNTSSYPQLLVVLGILITGFETGCCHLIVLSVNLSYLTKLKIK